MDIHHVRVHISCLVWSMWSHCAFHLNWIECHSVFYTGSTVYSVHYISLDLALHNNLFEQYHDINFLTILINYIINAIQSKYWANRHWKMHMKTTIQRFIDAQLVETIEHILYETLTLLLKDIIKHGLGDLIYMQLSSRYCHRLFLSS